MTTIKEWTRYMRAYMLNRRLLELVRRIEPIPNFANPLACRLCEIEYNWIRPRESQRLENGRLVSSEFTVNFSCPCCEHAKPILQTGLDAGLKLTTIMEFENSQLLASKLFQIFVCGYMLHNLSPPAELDNPIHILIDMLKNSNCELKLGGKKDVIVADIYENAKYFIIYLADTVAIPTRYFIQVLNYKFSLTDENTDEMKEQLIEDLKNIGNSVIKSGSMLVLGEQLQRYISPSHYKQSQHKFSAIVPLDKLRPFDKKINCQHDAADNFTAVVTPAIQMCTTVNEFVLTGSDHSFEYYSKCMDTAVWLKIFLNSPFEVFIYNILSRDDVELEQNVRNILNLAQMNVH